VEDDEGENTSSKRKSDSNLKERNKEKMLLATKRAIPTTVG
jgi:hypothetical protein